MKPIFALLVLVFSLGMVFAQNPMNEGIKKFNDGVNTAAGTLAIAGVPGADQIPSVPTVPGKPSK